jgi:hypothetical protein
MKREMSFSQRLDDGWTKEKLMAYFALTVTQYEKVLANLKAIRGEIMQKGG